MEMMDMAADDTREELRRKLRSNFDGRIVRKDLTKKIKEGANVPVYVLDEVETASDLLCVCVKLAVIEKLLAEKAE